jgi:ribosomal 50S subunit-associated protein YjgA (DUF615 family)
VAVLGVSETLQQGIVQQRGMELVEQCMQQAQVPPCSAVIDEVRFHREHKCMFHQIDMFQFAVNFGTSPF